MKTKNNIKFHISLLALTGIIIFSFMGCSSDLLDTTPSNAVSSGTIWTTSNLATQAVTGVYSYMRSGEYDSQDAGEPTFDVISSYCDYDVNWLGNLPMLNGNATASSGIFLTKWKFYYEIIHRANDVIANIDKVPDMSDALKSQYKAECKFLRAYYYYRANILYRGVPLYLEPVEVVDCTKGRSTEQEIWNAIIADLTDCINEPTLPNKYASNSTSYGRVTKGAAYSLRGKVYLWMKDWAKAEQDFKTVTTLGYALFSDYKALFKTANEKCNEMIFSIQFLNVSGYSHRLTRAFGNRVTGGSAWNNYIANPTLAESYECEDGKLFDWDDFLPGYSSMTPRERSVFFLRDNMTETEIATMTTFGADMTKYLPNGNEARILPAYVNRDPRLGLNVITPYSTYVGGVTGSAVTYTLRWPWRSINSPSFDVQTDTNAKFYYLIRKFVPEGTESLNINLGDTDIPLIRYADVLLNLAEALNEQDKTDEAITYVNQVRDRVGHILLNTAGSPYTTVQGQADMRERIRNERYWELPFEEHMYFDELRWETWKDKKFSAGNGMREVWGLATYTYKWGGDHFWIWPIPRTEVEMNSNLTQNPGWVN